MKDKVAALIKEDILVKESLIKSQTGNISSLAGMMLKTLTQISHQNWKPFVTQAHGV